MNGDSPAPQTAGRESAIKRLGTAESRSAAYRSLTINEKADLATVYYRVYPLGR